MYKKQVLHKSAVLLCVCFLFALTAVSALAASGWQAENGSLYYYLADGSKAIGAQTIDGTDYQFLADGRLSGNDLMVATPDGTYCISGASLVTGYKAFSDELFYFDANGVRLENGKTDSCSVENGVVQGDGVYVRNGTVRFYLENNKIAFSVSDYDTQLVLSADNTSAGKQTSVQIALQNNPGIANLKIELHFDKTKLSHTFTYNENLLSGFAEEETENGMLLTWETVADCETDGKLVTLYFTAADEQGDTLVSAVCTQASSADERAQTVKPAAAKIEIGCAHEYGEYIYNNDATCVSDGTKTAVCGLCEATDTVKAPNTQLPHTGGSASCMAKAVCEVCKSPYGTYDTNIHLHKVSYEAKDPTCYENGWTAYERCTDCTKELGKTVLYATNHKNAYTVPAKLPTCTKNGYSQHVYCPDCNRVSGYEAVEPTGHRNIVSVPALAPTCTEDGYEAHSFCTDCETALDKKDLPATNHASQYAVIGKDPTCEEDGYSAYLHCPDCNTDFGKEVIEKLAHKNAFSVEAKAVTCTEDGYSEHTHCPDCNMDFGKEIFKAQGHPATETVPAFAPTCTELGYEEYKICTVCGEEIDKVVLLPLGHRDLTDCKAVSPTCTEDGNTAYKICGICKLDVGKTVLPALNHKNKYTVGAKDPTCTEDGHNTYVFCPDCNTAFDKQTYPAKNHGDKVFTEGLPPTCSADGYSAYYHCPDCNENIGYEVLPALQHKNATAFPEQPATCTQAGVKSHIVCPDCGLTIGKAAIPPLNHKNKYTVSAVAPTCTESGQTSYVYCPDCGLEEGKKTLPPTDHTFTIWLTEQPAGFEKEGVEARWCSGCQTIERRSLPALTLDDGVIYQCGDLDKNGFLTAEDARSALRFAVGLDAATPLQNVLADYDGNGEVTAADARLLLRAAVGLDEVSADLCFATPDGYFERLKNEAATE